MPHRRTPVGTGAWLSSRSATATAAGRSSGVTTDKTAARASRLRTAASQLLTGTLAPR